MDFVCPRCSTSTSDEFYGPCASCRDELRVTMARDKSDIEVAAYEPKMNVVPNQIATKD
jgi:hypothetical protein